MAILGQSMTLPSQSPPAPSSKATWLINRAKLTGRCTPTLLPTESELFADDKFLLSISNSVEEADSYGLSLRKTTSAVKEFQIALKMAQSANIMADKIDLAAKCKILMQRRAILLLIIGCTSGGNPVLRRLLTNGLLVDMKMWLDEILTSKVGGVDLLLHLLSCICMLPVSKEMVTSSKLGKQVAAVEKHKICVGSMNESAIKERVSKVKKQWSASVKRMKKKDASTHDENNLKRRLDNEDNISTIPSKKVKTADAPPKKMSLSNLVQQVSGGKSAESDTKTLQKEQMKIQATSVAKMSNTSSAVSIPKPMKAATTINKVPQIQKKGKKKNRHIRWADHEGGPISVSHEVERSERKGKGTDGKESWKDRKKRDRLKEKELIQNARKSKLVDKDDSLDTMAMIFSSKWHQPKLLPPDPENPPLQVDSKEVAIQTKRMASVMPVNYLSEDDVPHNPYPLTETELTMDFNAQSAAVPQIITFFFSQPPIPTSAPVPLAPPSIAAPSIPIHSFPPPLPMPLPPIMAPPPTVATIEIVRSMGLPDFLVGQNIQALQALVASPGLLNTFLDVNGNYDQMRIMNLIQAMNQQLQKTNIAAPPMPPPPIAHVPAIPPPMQPSFGHYGSTQTHQYTPIPQVSSYKPPVKLPSGSYRGDQNNTDGNLHLSGYGPDTSTESILALFAPYVKIDEVVPKSGFMFLNTNDPDGARRAREALNGVMIGGSPLRINLALRRNKNPAMAAPATSMMGATVPSSSTLLPRNALGQVDFDAVRDDRGNPATKNLFVAGYGQGTTEQQLRDVFNQHTQVTGVVIKGSFSFVNTSGKESAVLARQALVGSDLNGGSLRINFAKESGRLGTSFDTGYNAPKRTQALPNHYGHAY